MTNKIPLSVKTAENMLLAVEQFPEKQAFLFDMDGLIFDTERIFMEQLAIVMKEEGYSLTKEIYLKTLGLGGKPLEDLMCSYFGSDYPFHEMGKRTATRITMLSETLGLPLKPYVTETLQMLKKKQKKLAVASTTKTEQVITYLKNAGIFSFFDAVIGGDTVSRSKPEPDIFLAALNALEVPAGQAVVLEDSENGVRAGKAAGCSVICIPDLKFPAEEILQMINVIVCYRNRKAVNSNHQ